MTGAVNYAVNLNDFAANNVKDKIGFDHKGPISQTVKFVISWDVAKKWINSKAADALVRSEGVGSQSIQI